MARLRLARPAQIDLATILSVSEERWEAEGRQRYADHLAAALRQVAADPDGPLSRARPELRAGIRSFHIRHVHETAVPARVRRPVHVLFYRVIDDEVVEIIRVLHERMDPRRHLDEAPTDA